MIKLDSSGIEYLVKLLSQTEGVPILSDQEFNGSWLHSEDWETELRLAIYCGQYIMISRVLLQNRRVGTMTHIFDWMRKYACENKLAGCMVQAVSTPEMVSWCLKNGFSPKLSTFYESNGCQYGDYYFYLASRDLETIRLD